MNYQTLHISISELLKTQKNDLNFNLYTWVFFMQFLKILKLIPHFSKGKKLGIDSIIFENRIKTDPRYDLLNIKFF